MEDCVELEVAAEEEDQEIGADAVDAAKDSEVLHHAKNDSLMDNGICLDPKIHLSDGFVGVWDQDAVRAEEGHIVPSLPAAAAAREPVVRLLKDVLSEPEALIRVNTSLKLN